MTEIKQNKMEYVPIKKLVWQMGLPMIVSMVLQALYNVVDSVFVSNMNEIGMIANVALTYAFPIQILMIAIGVGTGIGLNTMLSKSLGEKNFERTNKVAGNGIFLSFVIYLIFLIFGLFFTEPFIKLFTNNESVISMGSDYLKICCCFSFGSIGYTVFERLLQSTGKTMLSTISQISGAVTNVVLDYVFIFPLNMGIKGAAIATVLGQIVSLLIAGIFHFALNKEIKCKIKDLKPSGVIIGGIYKIGVSAAIMQAMLSVMMAGMNLILGGVEGYSTILVGSFGIYYKIQQIALFSAFGLSNTIITLLSFNYGRKNAERSKECIKYGILDTLITCAVITILFEIIASPLSKLFALNDSGNVDLVNTCIFATRIGAISFVFMGLTVSIQGVLQAFGFAVKPLILSLCRLAVFVFPIAYLLTLTSKPTITVWWTFLIAEVITDIFALIFLKVAVKSKIHSTINNDSNINI